MTLWLSGILPSVCGACLVTHHKPTLCSSKFQLLPNAAKPKFSVRNDSHEGNVYKLHPYERSVKLNASVSGLTVVNCSATGYPDPTYTWQVNDSCSRVENGGKVWH